MRAFLSHFTSATAAIYSRMFYTFETHIRTVYKRVNVYGPRIDTEATAAFV